MRLFSAGTLGIGALLLLLASPGAKATAAAQPMPLLIRLSEIEVVPEYLDEYEAILKKESAASVRLEPGVVSIFPMAQQEHSAQIRILEIYASRAAYESHLQTPHFQEYKATTLRMVKSLKLIEMRALDEASMTALFRKLP